MRYCLLTNLLLLSYVAFCNYVNNDRVKLLYVDKVFIIREDSINHIAFPSVVRFENDSLLVVYREAKIHQIDSLSRLVFQKGSIDASNWTHARKLLDINGMDERDPSIKIIEKSKIALTFFGNLGGERLYKPYVNSIYYGTVEWKSGIVNGLIKCDDGLDKYPPKFSINEDGIWVDENSKVISMHCTSSPVIQINNKLLIPAYGEYPRAAIKNVRVSPPYRIFFLESNDFGKTWNKRLINPKKLNKYWLGEPSVIKLTENHMLMHIRTAKGRNEKLDSLMQAESFDQGKTWINYKKFNFIGQAPDLYLLSDGTIISAFREIDRINKLTFCSFFYSTDQGKTWSDVMHIEECPNFDCGYPSITELFNGDILIVYYSDMGHSIKGAIIKKTNNR